MEKSEIIKAIENRVEKYSVWTIGITNDPDRRRKEHEADKKDTKYWKEWKADSERDARDIEKHFKDKGMGGDTGGGDNPTYVYIF